MRTVLAVALAATILPACAPAGRQVPPDRLRLSAADAVREAHTRAVSWAPDAVLRWVEGRDVRPDGYVLPDAGRWDVVYDAPGRDEQLVVTVTPTGVEQSTRAPQSPPGFVIGDAAVAPGWIDSPRAAAAGAAADTQGSALSMLLVPIMPQQWVVRAEAEDVERVWRVDAGSGALLEAR